jgi:DNA-binding MarR family transcriptional regulator
VTADDLPLPTLLSRLLIAFTLDFERESAVSLAMAANALRVLTADGVRIRELPHLTGVSKEALSMAAGILTRRAWAVAEPDRAAGRGKLIRLTPGGLSARDDYLRLLDVVERRWRARFGPGAIDGLRRSLLSVTGQRDGGRPRLALGLQPYPDGWRARGPYLRQTTAVLSDPGAALPHYPMVLHRGGWPDGS